MSDNLDNDYKAGYIEYDTSFVDTFDDINKCVGTLNDWDDGYLSFSTNEFRRSAPEISGRDLETLMTGAVNGIKDTAGYLLEVDLWRTKSGVYEEISIEREDKGFLWQKWRLFPYDKIPADREPNCYYRKVKVYTLDNSKVFKPGKTDAIEVVCYEKRMVFFMTYSDG
ncbi:hypothetical protein MCHI_004043 [Candidatus Magnetoovum chiemensis]|nr:hypothetical protein MCHI_004043 [Candidatus Magnetoovum chiemensis]